MRHPWEMSHILALVWEITAVERRHATAEVGDPVVSVAGQLRNRKVRKQ